MNGSCHTHIKRKLNAASQINKQNWGLETYLSIVLGLNGTFDAQHFTESIDVSVPSNGLLEIVPNLPKSGFRAGIAVLCCVRVDLRCVKIRFKTRGTVENVRN